MNQQRAIWYLLLGFILGGFTRNLLPSPLEAINSINPIVVNVDQYQSLVVPQNYLGKTTCPKYQRLFEQEEGLAIMLQQNRQGKCEIIAAPAKKRLFVELQSK